MLRRVVRRPRVAHRPLAVAVVLAAAACQTKGAATAERSYSRELGASRFEPWFATNHLAGVMSAR
jgi:hypothetical protein